MDNTHDNREKLSRLRVENMDVESLRELVANDLYEKYDKDDRVFQGDLDLVWYCIDEEGNWKEED